MSDSYVCSKAKIKCSCGDKISTLTVFPDRTILLTGEPQANISDHISMRNIAPFGKCHTTRYPATGAATAANHGKLTPMPCVPNTPFPWMGGKNDVLLKGEPALLKTSKCKCIYGGTITITHDGQTVGNTTPVPTVPKEEFTLNEPEELSFRDGDVPIAPNRPVAQKKSNNVSTLNPQAKSTVGSAYKKVKITARSASLQIKNFDKLEPEIQDRILSVANSLPGNISVYGRLKIADNARKLAAVGKIPMGAPMTIEEADMQSANPKYEIGNGYSINCATAVAAYVMRLRGFNVTAKPREKGSNSITDRLAKNGEFFKVWKNANGTKAKPSTYRDWMKSNTVNKAPITKMTPDLYKRFISDKTLQEGVYIISARWKNTEEQEKNGRNEGHVAIIQTYRDKEGKLKRAYIDPQVYNKKAGAKQCTDVLVDKFHENPGPEDGIMRVDDKLFDTNYTSIFEAPKEETPDGNTGKNKK